MRTANSLRINWRLLKLGAYGREGRGIHILAVFDDFLITTVHIHGGAIDVVIDAVDHLTLLGDHRCESLEDISLEKGMKSKGNRNTS